MYPKIKGLLKNTFLDWPGKISTIIFLQGCGWRCHYCHSPHLLSPETNESIPEEEVLSYIRENREWIDGVVVCGGEPTFWSELPTFLEKFKLQAIPLKLDTNGFAPEMLKEIIDNKLADLIAMDIKTSLVKEKYELLTEATIDIDALRSSIDTILSSGIDHEFRTTLCPLYVAEEDILNITQNIKGANLYALQQFDPENSLNQKMLDVSPYPREVIEGFQTLATPLVKKCVLRGDLNSSTIPLGV